MADVNINAHHIPSTHAHTHTLDITLKFGMHSHTLTRTPIEKKLILHKDRKI